MGLPANVSTMERAFELAATGHFVTVTEIKLVLAREGYQYEQVAGARAFQATRGGHGEGTERPSPPIKGRGRPITEPYRSRTANGPGSEGKATGA